MKGGSGVPGAWAIRWCLVYEAVLYGLGLVVASGLIPAWGQWYSASKPHRAQVEAFLQGRLALSHSPAALAHDLTWSEGGVHQVWGLGVPLWRLPFEVAARLVGSAGFPDMLAFAAALGLAAWALLRALFGSLWLAGGRSGDRPEPAPDEASVVQGSARTACWLAGASALVLLFPPFVNLLSTRFEIWEEVIAYEYVLGLVLLAGLISLAQWPTRGRYWRLCALAGLGGLLRPTLVFHGAATVVAGAWALLGRVRGDNTLAHAASSGRPGQRRGLAWLRTVAVGLALFGLGGAVLYGTNLVRFGSGFEFGHKLNVQHLYGSLYATRFDHPYAQEPFLSAARELFGLLFLVKEPRLWDFYGQNLFPGQSPTVRWREIGLSTYDLSYLGLIVAGWAAGVAAVWRLGRRGCADQTRGSITASWQRVVGVLALYSLLAAVPLLAFYLRNCVIATRYVLDLMPAFAAAMLAGWLAWGNRWRGRRFEALALGLSGLLLVGWLGWQIAHARNGYGAPRVLRWAAVAEGRRSWRSDSPVQFPAEGCYESARAPKLTGVPYNGAGWDESTGRAMPCVILFVDDPEFVELALVADANGPVPADPAQIRAKVGLEFLRLERIEPTAQGWTVRFSGPRQKRYQRGVQPVFLATVPNQFLAEYKNAPWRLERVRWRAVRPAF